MAPGKAEAGMTARKSKYIIIVTAVAVLIVTAVALMWYPPLWQPGYAPFSTRPFFVKHVHQDKVRVNLALPAQLAVLPGVGEKKAEAIVAYRQENGPFLQVEDLLEVSGIGEKTLAGFRDMICFCTE